MATMYGLTGKVSGKMGSAVFRVRDGQQVVTQYNPIVKNPNTEAQQENRAAFKLMSQLAAVMSPALGGFGTLGVTKRPARGKSTQRNLFLQKNYALVETDSSGETVVAKIPMARLQLTSSFRNLPKVETAVNLHTANIEINNMSGDIASCRLVLVAYPLNGEIVPSILEIKDVPTQTIQGDTSCIASFENLPVGNYTVLAYGLIPSESASIKSDLDNIHTPEDEDFISAVELQSMIASGDMAVTKTMGANLSIED